MRVFFINPKTKSGLEVHLDGIQLKKIKSLSAINKIATDRDVCVFINRTVENPQSKKFHIMALAYKFNSIMRGAAQSSFDSNVKPEELSVKLYNVVMFAIDKLERKMQKNN